MRRVDVCRVVVVAAAMLAGAGGCGGGKERTTEAVDAAKPPSRVGEHAAQGIVPPPPPPAMRLPELPTVAQEDLPPALSTVWWTVSPTGATVRITAPNGTLTTLEGTGRLAFVLAPDFYDVEVTHPACEPWSRRLALGGSVTNQVVHLTVRAAPAVEAPAAVAAASAQAAGESLDDAANVVATLAIPRPRPSLRPLTLESLDALPATTPVDGVGELTSVAVEGTPATPSPPQPPSPVPAVAAVVPAPRPEAPPTVASVPDRSLTPRPVKAPPVDVVAAPAPAPAPEPKGRVRISVVSTIENDEALARVPKHLHIGRRDVRAMRSTTLEFPRAAIGRETVALRIARYDVTPLAQTLSDRSDGDVEELVFTAVPHPVTVALAGVPPSAEVWSLPVGGAPRKSALASQPLLLMPFLDYQFEVRFPGLQAAHLKLRGTEPGATLPAAEVRLLPLPYSGRPGQACRIYLGHGADMALVWVPGGQIVMTDPRYVGAPPDVTVETLPRGFWMVATEVTVRQWNAVMERRDSGGTAGDLPKTGVSWDAANQFASRLGRLVPRSAVRLPTESEWEHAARGGSTDALGGVPSPSLCSAETSGGTPRAADHGVPNAWGLSNLPGNVREWCASVYGPYRGGASAPARRVVRGGGFLTPAADCRVDVRDAAPSGSAADDLGFRVVLQVSLPPAPH